MNLRAPALRAANLFGDLLLRPRGVRRSLLSADALLSAAERRTGLDDWGDDGCCLASLRVLVDSFERDVNMHPVGRWFFMRHVVLSKLVNRLLVVRDLKRHPEINDVRVESPIFITGLPRTGTTLLHRMTAQVSSVRTLQLWELLRPSPPPDRATYATDRRRRLRHLPLLDRMALGVGMRAQSPVHHAAANEPEECTHLLMNTLATRYFGMYGWAQRYLDWLGSQDLSWTYRFYKRQLQLLTWRCPGPRLVLKAPIDLRHLDELSRVFPDACFVLTHREPSAVLGSTCSMLARFRGLFSDTVDPLAIGREMSSGLAAHLDAACRFRDRNRSARVLDVRYRELVRDPVATLARIGAAFDLRLTGSCLSRVRAHLAADTHRGRAPHRYDLETYGITRQDVSRIEEIYPP